MIGKLAVSCIKNDRYRHNTKFQSSAQLQPSVLQGTKHRIFNATSDCQSCDVFLKKNQEILTENHYPTEWSSSIVNDTLDKIVTEENFTAKPPKNEQHLKKVKRLNKKELKPTFFSIQRKHHS